MLKFENAPRVIGGNFRSFHDNKGNRALHFTASNRWMVWDNRGSRVEVVHYLPGGGYKVTREWSSPSGAAKAVTGYETNGRKYWKFDAPTTERFDSPLQHDIAKILAKIS